MHWGVMDQKRYRRINIEISNVCNLQCSFCPEVERPKHVMTPEELRGILLQAAPLCDEVCLHLMGEPLGHPQFAEMVDMCAAAAVPVNLTTNGMLLRGKIAETVLRPIVRQLNISVHSYLDNFPQSDPRRYLERLENFLARALLVRPDLYVNLRLWDLGEDQSRTESGEVLRQSLRDMFGVELESVALDIRRRKNVPLRGRQSLHFDSRFVWPDLNLPERSRTGTCMGLKTHFGIHADGTVVPCCLDKEAVLKLGNIHESNLSDILSSPRAENIRQGFELFELREDLCRKCSFISRFDRKKPARGNGQTMASPQINLACGSESAIFVATS